MSRSDHNDSDSPDLIDDSSNDADERVAITGSEYHDDEGNFVLDVSAAHPSRDSRRAALDGKRRTRVSSAERELLKNTDNAKEHNSMLKTAKERQRKYDDFCATHLEPFKDIINGIDRETGEADPSLAHVIAKYQSKSKAPRFSDTVPQSVASLMRSGYFDVDGQNAEHIAHAIEVAKALPWQDRKFLKKKKEKGQSKGWNNNNNNNSNSNSNPHHETDSDNDSNNDVRNNSNREKRRHGSSIRQTHKRRHPPDEGDPPLLVDHEFPTPA